MKTLMDLWALALRMMQLVLNGRRERSLEKPEQAGLPPFSPL